jgi:transcription initiation factor TFIIIB Brf1 subunit/transcription initiation factor TFIIB
VESDLSDTIVNTLQQLKIGTYDSIRQSDPRYSLDTYKNGIKGLESRGQVRRLVFNVGKSERYAWLLPWYDDDARAKLQELKGEVLAYLSGTPSTTKQLREHFKGKYPAHFQLGYLVLRQLAASGDVIHLTFNEGRWFTVYYLPDRKDLLDELVLKTIEHVNLNGSGFSQDLSESLKIPKSLASALLAHLAHENKISKIKVGWSYARNMPIFTYCKEGHETEAVSRYQKLANKRLAEVRRSRLVETFLAKYRGATDKMRVNESLADLAGSYLDQVIRSSWTKGRAITVAAWACFFLAARILRLGITMNEIESYGKVKGRLVLGTGKELNDFLQLSVPDLYPRPSDYLPRIVEKMRVSEKLLESNGVRKSELLEEARRVLSAMPRSVSFGRKAQGVAAAALYLTAEKLGITEATQARIADAADITEVSLRNILKSAIAMAGGDEPQPNRNKLAPRTIRKPEPVVVDEMRYKGLLSHTDRNGIEKWGTPEQVQAWIREDMEWRDFWLKANLSLRSAKEKGQNE